MLESLNEFLAKYEPIWLLVVLLTETAIGGVTLYWIIREYDYDFQKDASKKQRRTHTKKTTTNPGGSSTIEETDITEPILEPKVEKP